MWVCFKKIEERLDESQRKMEGVEANEEKAHFRDDPDLWKYLGPTSSGLL